MSSTSIDIEKDKEQIKNEDLEKVKHFYQQLKVFLEKDKFDVFKLKKNLDINDKIELTNSRIQKLIDLKVKIKSQLQTLLSERKLYLNKNVQLVKKICSKLELKK